jgi:hypothetical protein
MHPSTEYRELCAEFASRPWAGCAAAERYEQEARELAQKWPEYAIRCDPPPIDGIGFVRMAEELLANLGIDAQVPSRTGWRARLLK